MEGTIVSSERELHLSDQDFERIVAKVYKMTGIVLQDHKRQMIYARLSKRLRELKISTFKAYMDFIETANGRGELEKFTNSVTTNITGFFRENHHFEHLAGNLKSPNSYTNGQLKIWSAGCSSGQEPYSIAMTVLEKDMQFQNSLRILATDLDTSVLEKARAGRYPMKHRKDFDPKFSKFLKNGESEFEVSDALKRCVSYKRLNVFEDWPFDWKFNYIFCRNILIYFDVESKNRVISRLIAHLNVGGFLYLGHSESLFESDSRLRSCGQTIYERMP